MPKRWSRRRFCGDIKNSVSLPHEQISGLGFIASPRTTRLTVCASDRRKTRDGKRVMKHMKEEELIAYREGVAEQRAVVAEHLAACERCRAEMERIEAVLAALDTLPVPDPGADYGRQVWKEIAPRLAEKPDRWWQVWFEPRRLSAAGGIVALIIAAFVVGRITKRVGPADNVANREQVRERVLVVAVGEDLG